MSSDHESIQFELPKELKETIQDIFFDHKSLNIYFRNGPGTSKAIRSKVYKASLRSTLELFDKKIDCMIDHKTKLLCVYSIKYNLGRYVKFDDDEQKWYSENFPNDPSNLEQNRQEDNDKGDQKPTKAQLVLNTAKASYYKLFVDEYHVPHAAISINGHLEISPLKSKRFRNWIAGIVYRESGIVVDSQTIKDIIGVLSAEAEFNDEEPIKLDLRVAARTVNGKTAWYIDLTNKDWEFIEITSNGWRIVNNKIIFRRFTNQSPQVWNGVL